MFEDNDAIGDHNVARHRRKRQQRRLLNSLLDTFRGDERVKTIGRDPVLRALIDERFDVRPAIAKCQVVVGDQSVTVVVVPDRLWHRPGAMGRLLDASRAMAKLDRVCLLYPQWALGSGIDLVDCVMRTIGDRRSRAASAGGNVQATSQVA